MISLYILYIRGRELWNTSILPRFFVPKTFLLFYFTPTPFHSIPLHSTLPSSQSTLSPHYLYYPHYITSHLLLPTTPSSSTARGMLGNFVPLRSTSFPSIPQFFQALMHRIFPLLHKMYCTSYVPGHFLENPFFVWNSKKKKRYECSYETRIFYSILSKK